MADKRFPPALLLAVLLVSGLTATAAARCADLLENARNGLHTLLIVAPKSSGELAHSEAYGDWVAYRDAFLAHPPPVLCLVTMTAAEYRRLVAEPALRDRFATIFVRDWTHAMIYQGMVLEPAIYQLGVRFLRGEDIDGAPHGLQASRLSILERWR